MSCKTCLLYSVYQKNGNTMANITHRRFRQNSMFEAMAPWLLEDDQGPTRERNKIPRTDRVVQWPRKNAYIPRSWHMTSIQREINVVTTLCCQSWINVTKSMLLQRWIEVGFWRRIASIKSTSFNTTLYVLSTSNQRHEFDVESMLDQPLSRILTVYVVSSTTWVNVVSTLINWRFSTRRDFYMHFDVVKSQFNLYIQST